MQSILVLCRDNTCLSKMAEAYLRFFTEGQYEVISAGLRTNIPLDVACQDALVDDKLELNSLITQDVKSYSGYSFDYLLTLDYGPDFLVPADISYNLHQHYEFEWPVATPHAQSCALIVEEVKRAVLHFIGGNLRAVQHSTQTAA